MPTRPDGPSDRGGRRGRRRSGWPSAVVAAASLGLPARRRRRARRHQLRRGAGRLRRRAGPSLRRSRSPVVVGAHPGRAPWRSAPLVGGAGDVRVEPRPGGSASSSSWARAPPGVLGALALAAELERSRRRVAAPWPSASAPSSAAAGAGRLGQPRPAHADRGHPGHGRGARRRRCRRPGRGPRATTASSSTEADRLARLVDDLFELSRIEADALQLTVEQVPLGELVSDAVASAARGGRRPRACARRSGRRRRRRRARRWPGRRPS